MYALKNKTSLLIVNSKCYQQGLAKILTQVSILNVQIANNITV